MSAQICLEHDWRLTGWGTGEISTEKTSHEDEYKCIHCGQFKYETYSTILPKVNITGGY